MLAITPVCIARFPNCTVTVVESYFDDQGHVNVSKNAITMHNSQMVPRNQTSHG